MSRIQERKQQRREYLTQKGKAYIKGALVYIPPVTPDTLPSEEVLVRGSEQPYQAQSEMLVRPATQEQESPAGQLLRVSEGEPQD